MKYLPHEIAKVILDKAYEMLRDHEKDYDEEVHEAEMDGDEGDDRESTGVVEIEDLEETEDMDDDVDKTEIKEENPDYGNNEIEDEQPDLMEERGPGDSKSDKEYMAEYAKSEKLGNFLAKGRKFQKYMGEAEGKKQIEADREADRKKATQTADIKPPPRPSQDKDQFTTWKKNRKNENMQKKSRLKKYLQKKKSAY